MEHSEFSASQLHAECDKYDGLPAGLDGWKLFAALKEARKSIGLSDAAIDTAQAMISMMNRTHWRQNPTCFASVQTIAFKRGRHPNTITRHQGELERAGVGIRTTHGYRRAVYDEDGAIVEALGFNFAPLFFRYNNFKETVETQLSDLRMANALSNGIKATRRRIKDAMKEITALLGGRLPRFLVRLYEALPRKPGLPAIDVQTKLKSRVDAVYVYATKLLKRIKEKIENMREQPPINERPLYTTNHSKFVSAISKRPEYRPDRDTDLNGTTVGFPRKAGANLKPKEKTVSEDNIPTSMVLKTAPADWQKAFVNDPSLSGLYKFAETRAHYLGISPDAWREARETFGAGRLIWALYVVDCKDRLGIIGNPGGYFRSLAFREARHEFRLAPTLFGLAHLKTSANPIPDEPTYRDPAAKHRPQSVFTSDLFSVSPDQSTSEYEKWDEVPF